MISMNSCNKLKRKCNPESAFKKGFLNSIFRYQKRTSMLPTLWKAHYLQPSNTYTSNGEYQWIHAINSKENVPSTESAFEAGFLYSTFWHELNTVERIQDLNTANIIKKLILTNLAARKPRVAGWKWGVAMKRASDYGSVRDLNFQFYSTVDFIRVSDLLGKRW